MSLAKRQPLQITPPAKTARTLSAARNTRSASVMTGAKFGRVESTIQSDRKTAILELAIKNVEAEIARLETSHQEQRRERLRLKDRD
jgi:hypothetical protein